MEKHYMLHSSGKVNIYSGGATVVVVVVVVGSTVVVVVVVGATVVVVVVVVPVKAAFILTRMSARLSPGATSRAARYSPSYITHKAFS